MILKDGVKYQLAEEVKTQNQSVINFFEKVKEFVVYKWGFSVKFHSICDGNGQYPFPHSIRTSEVKFIRQRQNHIEIQTRNTLYKIKPVEVE